MRIGYDVDGIGFNFGDSCHRYLIYTGQGHLWKSGPTPDPYWDFYKDWGWTGKDFVEFCNAGADDGFIFSGPMRPGYRESIKAVKDMGHTIVVATDRTFGRSPEVSQALTYAWFEQHDIPFDEMIFTADKTQANCDFFIEDKVENFLALQEDGTSAWLLTRPWNEYFGDHPNRIQNIEEYTAIIEHATKNGYVDLTF